MIISLSGKKLSGKNTCFNFIKEIVPEAQEFAFARALKRMCVDILGLREEQAFGSEADKNTIVPHLLWENFPVVVYHEGMYPTFCDTCNEGRRRSGPMTAREVLQYWGTDIFRRQYATVWADACIREIKASEAYANGHPCIITDCRFPDEVFATQDAGGKVIRLDRVVNPNDRHKSEIALDPDVFDWEKFDAILHNQDLDVINACLRLDSLLYDFGVTTNIPATVTVKAAETINRRILEAA